MPERPSLETLEAAAELVHAAMPPTPQYAWPLLAERAGCELWVKHENHTPIGAFKVRGGLVYMDWLKRSRPECPGVITATRGNHGQSIGFAARRHGLRATVLVPHGNSTEKNAAMRALGVELIEHGHDFQAAREEADRLAAERGLHFLGPFNAVLRRGTATYGLELLRTLPDLDRVYVPIGMGSGLTGTIAARDALGHRAEVIGVVAEQAPAYALSLDRGEVVTTETADTLADGLACRVPDAEALEIIRAGAADIVQVSDAEIAAAMRAYFTDTHNVAEGAGAAALAAVLKDWDRCRGKQVAVVLCGQNVDARVFREVLAQT
jgi:threonine dehydratase